MVDSTARHGGPASRRMYDKLSSEQSRAIHDQRNWLAEAPVGPGKWILGYCQFGLRDLQVVQSED